MNWETFKARSYLESIIFLIAMTWTISPWASPSSALAIGLIFGLAFVHPFRARAQILSRILLQVCIVALGFEMSLREVVRVGVSGFMYTTVGIAFSLIAGLWLGKILRVDPTNAFLVSVGTAICGGSAIAAVARVMDASDDQMSVSLGTVFILNAVGLLTFPLVGSLVGLSQTQFGLWAALAIHDTSSVVGAGTKYGAVALAVATVVKLARALWIVPVSLATAAVKSSQARIQFPWFIFWFVLATIFNSYVPLRFALYHHLANLGKVGLTLTLFLIGSNISPSTLRTVGVRALVLGLLLWVSVAMLSLWFIRTGTIAL
jgi:uncharacterized integral membrane protein (TIGR00698 family)